MTPEHANAVLASTRPVLASALKELDLARLVVRSHEAGLLMLREANAPGVKLRSAQAVLNGKKTKLGRAMSRVRQAGGIVVTHEPVIK